MQKKALLVRSRVEQDEQGNFFVRIPLDVASEAGLKDGDSVQVKAGNSSGELTITPMQIKPRANYDIREVGLRVIDEKRELLDRLAAYDRGEEP